MSKNKTKKGVVANKAKEKVDVKAPKLSTNKLAIIITCAVVALLLVAVVVVIIVDNVKNDRNFDYLKSDMSKYVYISPEDYKDYYLEVDIAEPREEDILSAILAIQAANKGDSLVGEGQWLNKGNNLYVTPGSLVNLWYRGYKINEKGEEIEIEGFSNFSSLSASTLEVGSLLYPNGFEVNLLGAPLSSDRVFFSKITDGSINDEHVVYINYTKTVTSTEKSTTVNNVRVDLSSDVDGEFGQGFKEELMKIAIGDTKEFSITDASGTHCKYKVKVNFATDCEKQDGVLKIDAYIPYSFSNETLRNEDIKFDVYIESIRPFEYDEFTDEFVTEVLEKEDSTIKAEDLEEYEGDGIADKYLSYLKKTLDDTYKKSYDSYVEEAVWQHLHSVVDIKKYPASKISELYDEYIIDIQDRYSSSGGKIWNDYTYQYDTYNTLDKYADAYLGMTSTSAYSWRDYVMDTAKELVAERMILFYIMDAENIRPSDADIEAEKVALKQEYLDEYVDNYLSYEGKTREDLEPEELEKYIAERSAEIFNYYDEQFFVESAYYNLVLDTLMSWADVSTLDERSNYPQDR